MPPRADRLDDRPGTAPGSPPRKISSAQKACRKIQRPSTAPEVSATASDWFECENLELTATTAGKLGEYMATPARKGMTNPPMNERVRRDLLEYLTYCGISCKPEASNRVNSLPSSTRSKTALSTKSQESRPVSRDRALNQSTSAMSIRNEVQSTSAPSVATSASAPELRERACTPDLSQRRQKRLMEGRGDLGFLGRKLETLEKLETMEARPSQKQSRRRRKGSGVPQRSEWEMSEATWGLQLQARMHKFGQTQTGQELGELGIYHNGAARGMWPTKLRQVQSALSPKFNPRKEQKPPSQFRPDRSQEQLVKLRMSLQEMPRQLREACVEGERRSGLGFIIPPTPEDRAKQMQPKEPPPVKVEEPKKSKEKVASGAALDMAAGLKRASTEKFKKQDIEVEGEALSPRTIMIREECNQLAKKNDLMVPFVEALREKFDKLDTSKDGSLSETEFVVMVQWLTKDAGGVPPSQLQRMWMEFDQGGDGEVNFSEFLAFLLRKFPAFRQMTPTELNRFLSSR